MEEWKYVIINDITLTASHVLSVVVFFVKLINE